MTTQSDVLQGLARLLEVEVDTLDRADLDSVVALSSRVRSWHDSFDLRCARRARELQRLGTSAGADAMFSRAGKRSSREGAAITQRAEAGEQLPSFEEGLTRGDVSAGHLDALAAVRRRLDDTTRGCFDEHADELLGAAAHERVDMFARRCRELAARLTLPASDADELDAQRTRANVRRWVDKSSGMHHTHLELDPLRDSAVWNAVQAALARRRRSDGNAGTAWQQLQVDAFVDAVQGGVVAVPEPVAAATKSSGFAGPGPSDAEHADAAIRRLELRIPEITVLVDFQTLVAGLHGGGVCETEDGVPLPVSTVRRLCCDAEIIPAVLGTRGELLELGRSARTVNRAQRRALRAMHRTCAHPDCTVPYSACRIHHVRFWVRDRGPTDIDNLLPLCERHHHLVHEGRWTVTMTADRVATWTRPDGTIDHRGSTIDRRPAGGGAAPQPQCAHRGDRSDPTDDRRPADRPMLT